MNREILNRYLDIQDTAAQDEQYLRILNCYWIADTHLIALVNSMTESQQEIICEYICSCADLHQWLMEIACEKME